jgi:hypothetical protein
LVRFKPMSKKKRPRIPESRVSTETGMANWAQEIALNRMIVERCKERSVVSNEQVPAVVDEVVRELYGGWTAKARNHVRSLEQQSGDDLGIPPQEAQSQEP